MNTNFMSTCKARLQKYILPSLQGRGLGLGLFFAAALLLGMTGCSKDDNTPANNKNTPEQDLVGLWWDEFEYSDVTEDGISFSRVLLAIDVEANHTGCLYLGVFDETSDGPLVIYGGPDDASFKWALLPDGRVQLSAPATGERIALSRTRSADDGIYGKDMTNVSETNLTYTDNIVTVNNTTYSGTLKKADVRQQATVQNTLSISAASADGTRGTYKDSHGRSRECIVVSINGQKYAVATVNENTKATVTVDDVAYYAWFDAKRFFVGPIGYETKANLWRLPTSKEAKAFGKLESKGNYTRTRNKRTWMIGKATLDLPLDGGYDKSKGLFEVNSQAYYWTSRMAFGPATNAYALNFTTYDGNPACELNRYDYSYGLSVRLFCQLPTK